MQRISKKILLTISILILLTAIGSVTLQFPGGTVDHILLAEWVEQNTFDPVILYPEPKNASLKSGPYYVEWLNYVEMSYINVGKSGVIHNFFQSDSFAPFFDNSDLLKMYKAGRDDVVTKQKNLNLHGQKIIVEIRRNEQMSNSGLTLFELEGTSVAHNWQGTTENEALTLLEQHVHLVTERDLKLINLFDKQLQERLKATHNVSLSEK